MADSNTNDHVARLHAEIATCEYYSVAMPHKQWRWRLIPREAADQQNSCAAEAEADDGLHAQHEETELISRAISHRLLCMVQSVPIVLMTRCLHSLNSTGCYCCAFQNFQCHLQAHTCCKSRSTSSRCPHKVSPAR